MTAPGTGSPTTRWRGAAGSARRRCGVRWQPSSGQEGTSPRPAAPLPATDRAAAVARLLAHGQDPLVHPAQRAAAVPGRPARHARGRRCSSPSRPARAPSAPEENGMAHFLEHLVFKGGEKYDDYRKVNETAERMGAVLNAYTSHDLVAFHITCRAEVVGDAIDLLTDFVGRPKLDQEELDRERGVVIQEIARANDQPSVVAEHLIDRAAFGDHPLGRPVLGPEEHLRTFSRDAILAFRRRQWAGARGGAFLVGNLDHVPEQPGAGRDVRALPVDPGRRRLRARAGVRAADARRAARLQPVAPADLLPPVDRRRATSASAPRSPSTARCSAARWARGCSTRSASSAASPTRSTRSTTRSPTCRSCSSPPGLESGKCVEAYTRMREIVDELRADGPDARTRSSGRARTRPAAACSRSRTRTPSRATRRRRPSSTAQEVDPDAAIAALDEVTFDEVAEVARGISEEAVGGLRRPARRRRVRLARSTPSLKRV